MAGLYDQLNRYSNAAAQQPVQPTLTTAREAARNAQSQQVRNRSTAGALIPGGLQQSQNRLVAGNQLQQQMQAQAAAGQPQSLGAGQMRLANGSVQNVNDVLTPISGSSQASLPVDVGARSYNNPYSGLQPERGGNRWAGVEGSQLQVQRTADGRNVLLAPEGYQKPADQDERVAARRQKYKDARQARHGRYLATRRAQLGLPDVSQQMNAAAATPAAGPQIPNLAQLASQSGFTPGEGADPQAMQSSVMRQALEQMYDPQSGAIPPEMMTNFMNQNQVTQFDLRRMSEQVKPGMLGWGAEHQNNKMLYGALQPFLQQQAQQAATGGQPAAGPASAAPAGGQASPGLWNQLQQMIYGGGGQGGNAPPPLPQQLQPAPAGKSPPRTWSQFFGQSAGNMNSY